MTLVPGEKLVLELENDQRWAVYSFCDGPLTLRWNTFTKALVASERCTGSLRLARLGAEVDELDSYASCSVLGGKLFAQDSFSYGWTFDTKGDCQQGLLHYRLHPHKDSMDMSRVTMVPGFSRHSTTRGPMDAYVTKEGTDGVLSWRLQEATDVSTGINPNHPSAKNASFFQPIGTDTPDTDVFASSFQNSSFHPPRFIVNSTQAIPTNAWWGNIIHAVATLISSLHASHLQPIGTDKPDTDVFA